MIRWKIETVSANVNYSCALTYELISHFKSISIIDGQIHSIIWSLVGSSVAASGQQH